MTIPAIYTFIKMVAARLKTGAQRPTCKGLMVRTNYKDLNNNLFLDKRSSSYINSHL